MIAHDVEQWLADLAADLEACPPPAFFSLADPPVAVRRPLPSSIRLRVVRGQGALPTPGDAARGGRSSSPGPVAPFHLRLVEPPR